MEFDFSAEQKQLKEQVRRFLSDQCDRKAVRAILDGPQPYDQKLWKGLGDLGYLGASIPETYGGLGLGYLEACVIAEELGRAVAPVPFCSSIALAAECLLLAGTDQQKEQHLPPLARGEAVATLAIAEGTGRVTAESIRTQASMANGHWTLTGKKLAVLDGDISDIAIVAATHQTAVSLFLVDLRQVSVQRESLRTIDPTRSHGNIQFNSAPAALLGKPGEAWTLLEQVYDRAAVLIAFEQLGLADRALEMGRDYALERFAFGRPIGSLQAIKHMLADMYVSATLARSNCYYGAWALSTNSSELPVAAATARVSTTQGSQHCTRNNIQVHGGMGFTWEFDCHLYYRRANLLAVNIGALSLWEDRLIQKMRPRQAA